MHNMAAAKPAILIEPLLMRGAELRLFARPCAIKRISAPAQ
jgi:hypothetical protein